MTFKSFFALGQVFFRFQGVFEKSADETCSSNSLKKELGMEGMQKCLLTVSSINSYKVTMIHSI
jgi:hypothetical protein